MLLSSLIFTSALLATSALAEINKEEKCKPSLPSASVVPEPPSKCSRQLEKIIYVPQTPAYNYLSKLMNELSVLLGGVFNIYGSQLANSIIQNFATKYQVEVTIQPPFSDLPNFVYLPNGEILTISERNIGHLIAPTYLNLRGFQYQVEKIDELTKSDHQVEIKSYAMSQYLQTNDAVGLTLIIKTEGNSFFGF